MTRDEAQAVIDGIYQRAESRRTISRESERIDRIQALAEARGLDEAATELRRALEKSEAAKQEPAERRALVQGDWRLPHGDTGNKPGTVAWSEHEEAWAQYDRDGHGSQSAERINARGGFGYTEMSVLLGRAPRTWKAGR